MAAKTNVPSLKGAKSGKPSGSPTPVPAGQYTTVIGTHSKPAGLAPNLGAVAGGPSTVNSTPSG